MIDATFRCECDTPERHLCRVTDHDGNTSVVLYCDGCEALARSNWNGETAKCDRIDVMEAQLVGEGPAPEGSGFTKVRLYRENAPRPVISPRVAAALSERAQQTLLDADAVAAFEILDLLDRSLATLSVGAVS